MASSVQEAMFKIDDENSLATELPPEKNTLVLSAQDKHATLAALTFAYPVAHVTEAGTIVASLYAVTDASAVQLA